MLFSMAISSYNRTLEEFKYGRIENGKIALSLIIVP